MTEKRRIRLRSGVVSLFVLLAALSRLLPHPPNFAPIGAIALFGGAYFYRRSFAYLIPIISMWLSDLILNNVVYGSYFNRFIWFYDGFYWTYGAFVLIVTIGFLLLKKVSVKTLLPASLLASVVFFLLSNFGVWCSTTMYPKDMGGILSCYVAGLPFFRNTLLGDLMYNGILFGTFELVQKWIPVLRIQPI